MEFANQSQSANAHLQLEALIVTLQLAPGAMLTEAQLIDRLGMGRTPIREALQRLSWQGLVEIRPRSGITVTEMNLSDFTRILAMRILLEPMLVATSVQRATAEQCTSLISIRDSFQKSLQSGDVLAYLHADRALDTYLLRTAADPFLENALATLQVHMRRFWYHFVTDHALDGGVDQHISIIDACLAGDEVQAVAAMRDQMSYAQREYEMMRRP